MRRNTTGTAGISGHIGTKLVVRNGNIIEDVETGWRYEYNYGSNGRIAKLRDNNQRREVWNEFDEANRPIRLTETTTDGTLLRQTRLSYSATEHPEDYAEKLYNTPGAGEYATNYTYDFNDRLTKAIFGTDSYRVTYTYLNSDIPIPGLSLQATTSLVSGISQTGVSFSYGYDTQTANIVSETRTGGAYAGTVTYEYD